MSLNWKEEISDADKARSIQGLPSEESMVLYPSARSLLESQTLFNDLILFFASSFIIKLANSIF